MYVSQKTKHKQFGLHWFLLQSWKAIATIYMILASSLLEYRAQVSFFTRKILGNGGVDCDSFPGVHLRSPFSPKGPHLPLLSVTACQNPPQKSVKGEIYFWHLHFALFRAGTKPQPLEVWPDHHIPDDSRVKDPKFCWGYSSSKKHGTAERRGGHDAIPWTLEQRLSLLLSGLLSCSCWSNDNLCDTSAN